MIINEIKEIIKFFINYFPGRSGQFLRRIFYQNRLASIGKNFTTGLGIIINYPKNIYIGDNCKLARFSSLHSCIKSKIKIGNNVSINRNSEINSCNGGSILIGNDVIIATNVVIIASNHIFNNKDKLIKDSGHKGGKIIIGNNVWIGSNAVILKDVSIGDGAVIGAGCVIRKDVKNNEIISN